MPEVSPTRFVMVPARRSSEPVARKRARRILGALFLAASLSIVAMFTALVKGGKHDNLSGLDPKGRDLAYMAATDFLMGEPLNLPHASSLDPSALAQAAPDAQEGETSAPLPYTSMSWVGFTPEHFGSSKSGFVDFEEHHFLVLLGGGDAQPTVVSSPPISGDAVPTPRGTASPVPTPTPDPSPSSPTVLQLDVPVLITPQGPRLAAAPAFTAWSGGTGGAAGTGDYTNYSNLVTDVSDAVKNQVTAWAFAYVGDDPNTLFTLTGDQDARHHYVGLSGFTLPSSGEAVQFLSAIKASEGQLIVRVRLMLTRDVPGATANGGTSQRFVTFADFDLLVGAPTEARPPIVAWGPAGSAAQLEPYSNALTS